MSERLRDRVAMKIAWMLPHSIAYWAFTRVAAHATTGKWGNECPDNVSVMDAMGRWYEDQPS